MWTTEESSGSWVQDRNIMREVDCSLFLRLQYQAGMFNQDLRPSSLGHTASPTLSSDLFKQRAPNTYPQTCAITFLYSPSHSDILDIL